MGAIPNFGLTLPSLLALGLVTLASGDNTVVETLVQYTTVLDIPGSSAATAAVTATSTGAPSYQTASLFRAQILNSTNFYRTQHNASALVWNSTLASFAHTVAEPCEFKHSVSPLNGSLPFSDTDTLAGWAVRRKPRGRLRQRNRIHRSLGQ